MLKYFEKRSNWTGVTSNIKLLKFCLQSITLRHANVDAFSYMVNITCPSLNEMTVVIFKKIKTGVHTCKKLFLGKIFSVTLNNKLKAVMS